MFAIDIKTLLSQIDCLIALAHWCFIIKYHPCFIYWLW